MHSILVVIVPLAFMLAYAGVAFAVIYFAVRLALKHHGARTPEDPGPSGPPTIGVRQPR